MYSDSIISIVTQPFLVRYCTNISLVVSHICASALPLILNVFNIYHITQVHLIVYDIDGLPDTTTVPLLVISTFIVYVIDGLPTTIVKLLVVSTYNQVV